ncbi:MAG TPA: hypothetical protein VFO34_18075 [Candidatus Acidoferrales bacterium]|nr:hypothetical protein [Candidatus Acidoferrales bacterium]
MMQQHRKKRPQHMTSDALVMVYQAATAAEAAVVRSLLESAGIQSPAPTYTDPFPMQEPPEGFTGTEVFAPKSQAEDAKQIIAASQETTQ